MPQVYYFECVMDDNGHIIIPDDIRQKLDIHPGDRLRFLSSNKDFLFQPLTNNRNDT